MRFFSIEVTNDAGMKAMLDHQAQCAGLLPLPMIEMCANTSLAQQEAEVDVYIPEMSNELNWLGHQECGISQTFGAKESNEEALKVVEELLNMPTAVPIAEDEQYDALMGNDIEDILHGAFYDDEEPNLANNVNVAGTTALIAPITYFVPTEAQPQINLAANMEIEDEGIH